MVSRIAQSSVTKSNNQRLKDTTPPQKKTVEEKAAETNKGWGPKIASNRVTNTLNQALEQSGPSSFEMIPGRYPDAVPLPQFLEAMGRTPQGQAALGQVLDGIKGKTGVELPAETRAAILANPVALTKALELTPSQLSGGILALNGAYQQGKIKQKAEATQLLPQHFDFAALDQLDVARPKSEMKELAPGLFQGDLPSTESDAQLKRNRVVAEVFQRLAGNASAAPDKAFSVTYQGKDFTQLEDFTRALKKDGYDVNVTFEERIANFANLKTAVPGSNPPKYLDVPAPLMVKTGVKGADGKEALVPATHSEMVISLKSGPATKGPKLDADLKYYQGVSGTGFFPANSHATPAWTGKAVKGSVSGDQALKAIRLAGAFTDLVNTTAEQKHLYADGYGVTGVCNDSVAVVQKALTGKATQYPLLMRDSVLMGEVEKRLKDANHSDDATFRSLRAAIRELPTDSRLTPSTKLRALESLPWEAGREPFASTVEARKILSE